MTGSGGVLRPDILELYLQLHAQPELSGREQHTAGLFAGQLGIAGFDVTEGVGGHGVVGVLRNGAGPTVLLRAELDALPVEERTGLPYASTVRLPGPGDEPIGVMHACGHDAHLAALAGTATELARRRAEWCGTIVAIGQPAEETLLGARAMLTDGLYTRFPVPDVVLGQHLAPLPAGVVAHSSGAMTAAAATLDVRVAGRGTHPGLPHLGVNPIGIAAAAVTGLRELSTAEVAVNVGTIAAGHSPNVVPDSATLGISVRAHRTARVDDTIDDITDVFRAAARSGRADNEPEVDVAARAPQNVNDPRHVALIRQAHRVAFPAGHVVDWPASLATEDFGWFGEPGVALHGVSGVATVYWMLGCVGLRRWSMAPGDTPWHKAATLPTNHSAQFAPDAVPTLRAGITALYTAATACLGGR